MASYEDRLARIQAEDRKKATHREAQQQHANPRIGESSGSQGGFVDTLKDVAVAPLRGVANAAQDIYGLADTLAFDALPDSNDPWLGSSKTTAGGLVEGIANFSAGFIPVVGWLGKGAKIGKGLSLAKGLSKAKGAQLLVKHGKKAAGAQELARAAVAGAIADFSVYDGHEERMSDFLQEFPMFDGAITQYFASDLEDSELHGRFKNAVEGLGAGMLIDSLWMGVKALKGMRRAKQAGAGADEVLEAGAKATEGDDVGAAFRAERRGAIDEQPVNKKNDDEFFGDSDPTDDINIKTEQAELEELLQDPNAPRVDPDDPKVTGRPEVETKRGTEAHERKLLRSILRSDVSVDDFEETLLQRTMFTASSNQGTAGVNPRKLSHTERLEQGLRYEDTNLSHHESPELVLESQHTIDELFLNAAQKDRAGFGSKSLDELDIEAAERLGDLSQEDDLQKMILGITKDYQNAESVNAIIRARSWRLTAEIEDLAAEIVRSSDGSLTKAELDVQHLATMEKIDRVHLLKLGVKGLEATTARALRAMRRRPAKSLKDLDEIAARLAENGDPAVREDTMKKLSMLFGDGGPEGVASLSKGMAGVTPWQKTRMLNEYWLGSLLSGGRTQTVNALSGMMFTVYRPLEGLVGAAISKGAHTVMGNHAAAVAKSEVVTKMTRDIAGLYYAFGDSMKYAWKAMQSGEAILDPLSRTIDDGSMGPQIIAKNAGLKDGTLAGGAVNWFGRIVRLPSKALSATDEFAKQLNYRATFRSELIGKYMNEGLDATSAAAKTAKKMDDVLFQGQQYSANSLYQKGRALAPEGLTSEQLNQFASEFVEENYDSALSQFGDRSLKVAREVTFTTPLAEGGLQRKVQQAVIQHPYLRLVMPFVRTPMNLLNTAGQRIDVKGVNDLRKAIGMQTTDPKYKALKESQGRLVSDMLSEDPTRQAEAVGRLAAGVSATTMFIGMANSGFITGRGPSDPERRKLLQNAGWQPYSFKYEGSDGKTKYLQYARFDPFATLLGLAADVTEHAAWGAEEDQSQLESVVWGMAVSAANNFTNKTYLTGLARFISVAQEPDTKMESFARSMAGSFVPNILNQSNIMFSGDDTARDVNGILEAMRARIPGLSDDLMPVRNILGEPVSKPRQILGAQTGGVADAMLPVAYTTLKDSVVELELVTLGHGFSPPKKTKNGLDLIGVVNDKGQTAYDRWSQLHGEIKIGGKSLRTALRALINSRQYKRMPQESTDALESPRISEINRVLQRYRRRALDQMMREYPEVAQHEQTRTANQRRARIGQFELGQ